jgi:hypothetical protein
MGRNPDLASIEIGGLNRHARSVTANVVLWPRFSTLSWTVPPGNVWTLRSEQSLRRPCFSRQEEPVLAGIELTTTVALGELRACLAHLGGLLHP